MMNSHFIPAGTTVNKDHADLRYFATLSKEDIRQRWKTQAGQEILTKWREAGFDRDALTGLTGSLYDHLDLRGAPLSELDFSNKNLHFIDFFAANLQKVKFSNANLVGVHFSEADIRGATFDWARMDGAFLDNAEFNENTSFLGVNLNAVNFTLAALLFDLAHTQQRIAHLNNRHPVFAAFLRISCDYGRSLSRWSWWVLGVILFFSLLFGFIPGLISKGGFCNGLYFSVVTFTTLGYGDILPVGSEGKILAVIEVLVGYLMGGLLVAILARKVLGD